MRKRAAALDTHPAAPYTEMQKIASWRFTFVLWGFNAIRAIHG